jgi:hypothetical protein
LLKARGFASNKSNSDAPRLALPRALRNQKDVIFKVPVRQQKASKVSPGCTAYLGQAASNQLGVAARRDDSHSCLRE